MTENKYTEKYIEQMMGDIYSYPEAFYELNEEEATIALKEMQKMYQNLTAATEQQFDTLRKVVASLLSYTKFLQKIVDEG